MIITHKRAPDPFEAVSLVQCAHILRRFDAILVQPTSYDIAPFKEFHPHLIRLPVPDAALASYKAFNRLKIDHSFYSRFLGYTHLLFYELDAFVFRDELEQWCRTPIDYFGAPWIEDVAGASFITGVGNGGFSLRRLSAALSILKSGRLLYRVQEVFAKRHIDSEIYRYLSRPLHVCEWLFKNRFNRCHLNFDEPEDLFWGHFVRRSFPEFRLPEDRQAIAFAFEREPRELFLRNDQLLPFGCHAWWTYDPSFWRPHIEAFGHSIPLDLPSPSTSFLMTPSRFATSR